MNDRVKAARISLSPEHIEEISKGFRYDEPSRVVGALWPLAQQYGISRLARDTGISRTHLYRLFGDGANPEMKTMVQLLRVFGVRISVSTL
jgi:probable addiction module antidote protein